MLLEKNYEKLLRWNYGRLSAFTEILWEDVYETTVDCALREKLWRWNYGRQCLYRAILRNDEDEDIVYSTITE